MIKYTGVNHLALVTGNMDETIRFWRDLLGMRLVAGLGQPGFRHYFFQLSEYDLVAFFEWPGIQPMPEKDHGQPVTGPFIFDHVSFGVETEEALWEIKDKLEAGGFEVSDVIDHGFIHSIYSFDPNGIPIEFSAQVSGENIRENSVVIDCASVKVCVVDWLKKYLSPNIYFASCHPLFGPDSAKAGLKDQQISLMPGRIPYRKYPRVVDIYGGNLSPIQGRANLIYPLTRSALIYKLSFMVTIASRAPDPLPHPLSKYPYSSSHLRCRSARVLQQTP